MLSIGVSTLISLFYLLSSGLICLVYAIPQFNSRFLAYGARDSQQSAAAVDRSFNSDEKRSHNSFLKTLDFLASVRVPHTWFLHFYVVSVASSLIWLHQILTRGTLIQLIAIHSPATTP